MSKNKQKNFLIGYGVVTGAAALGLLWMALGAGTARDTKADEVNQKVAAIKALKSNKLYPNSEFAANIKDRASELIAEAEKFNGNLYKLQVPWEPIDDGTAVQSKIIQYRDLLVGEAKGRGQALPSGFGLGLERYVDKAPLKDASPRLNFIASSMSKALNRILSAGITSVDKVYVVEADWEKDAEPAADAKKTKTPPKTTKAVAGAKDDKADKGKTAAAPAPALAESAVYSRFRVLIQFTGAEQNVQDALNTLLTSGEGEPFFVVNSMRVENEMKNGPTKEAAFNPEPLKEEVAEGETVSQADQIDPEVRDVRFILGSEKISAFLDADLLLFYGTDSIKEALSLPASSSK
jgi:hypothetical protein